MVRYGLPEGAWVKSSYSFDNNGACIETQSTPDGRIAVGDSKDRILGAHTFAPAQWQAFVTAVQDGSL
ncbi:DUF397 domain-containing protein [Streptomyces bacillaris]|uniref:DUF397 domain-containing protein n=1 Tax=Streptomyces bacillaris TaxID=68179 RepID=UPI001137A3FE|nr:DUF397 domain-containing protein [Streptomyces sp. S6]